MSECPCCHKPYCPRERELENYRTSHRAQTILGGGMIQGMVKATDEIEALRSQLSLAEKAHAEEASKWDEQHARQVEVWRKAEARAEAAEKRAAKLEAILRRCKTAFLNLVELQLLPHDGYDDCSKSLAQEIHEALTADNASIPGESAAPIPATLQHDAGAYARCSYCGRYSDDPAILGWKHHEPCDCGKTHGYSGSFQAPAADAIWNKSESAKGEQGGAG